MLHRRAYTCLIDIWNYICNIYISRYSYIYCNSSRYQVSLYHDKLTEQKVVEHGAGPSDQIHWNSWFVIRCNSGVRAGQQECCISWTCWIRRENSNVDDVKAKEVELFCLSGEKKKRERKKIVGLWKSEGGSRWVRNKVTNPIALCLLSSCSWPTLDCTIFIFEQPFAPVIEDNFTLGSIETTEKVCISVPSHGVNGPSRIVRMVTHGLCG